MKLVKENGSKLDSQVLYVSDVPKSSFIDMVISTGSLIEIEYINNVYKVKITTDDSRNMHINKVSG